MRTAFRIRFRVGLCFSERNYRNVALVFATFLETYSTVYQCVKSVVTTHTYIVTWVMNCSSLTNNDVTSFASFATEYLYA